MRLVLAGTPSVAIPSFEALLASDHEVTAVVTRPDAARGRSKRLVPSEVGQWAADHGIPALKPMHPRDPEFVAALTELAPDACPVVAYGALVPQHVLDIPRYGWVNLHFSLLPRWRGAAPVQRAVMAGDGVTGATTFRLVRELDAGPVYGTTEMALTGTETAGEVLEALAHTGARLLLDTIDALATTEPAEQDDEAAVTLAPKITVEEARIDWTRQADEIDRLVRGCSPEPMAWTTIGDERFKVALGRPTDEAGLAPGEVRVEKRRVLVGSGTTALELVRVQPQGKKEMAGADWGRGLRDAAVRFA
ncbi:methionyl-tRNA formyltransferase [Propioniciclava sp. MC1595]|uniref:methionyl-tRNA formyltransferase n=1 Tax=Propioniciclava sp. MC1595 TaxID=2760308 RepID=UPI0016622A98|nr:methionyl-tRNA formyltransferase [Propioniciclava sp. MC1595]MBB1495975.1 methionyl-tRNA formyltransferase [Propioniciclava sp. MC1595]QTE24644.1 methionyl-tRNA formyltransferase [Propioniciclava sp. MC1595]